MLTGRAATVPKGGIAAVGVMGVDGLLARTGSTKAMPIASITKLVTVMVSLQKLPLRAGRSGPTHVLTAADQDFYRQAGDEGLARLPVPAGTRLTERQLVEGALVVSSASHVMVLAKWAYGSLAAETKAANAWLKANGLAHTRVVEPTGIDPRDVSTTADLVRLGELVLADPALAAIVAERKVTIPGVGTVKAINPVLGRHGIDGIKTGNTTQAGYCLLYAAPVTVGGTPITVVAVVLHRKSWDTLAPAALALLGDASKSLQSVTLAAQGTAFGAYTTPWGDRVNAVLASPATVTMWGDAAASATVSLDPLTTVTAGEQVGTARFTGTFGEIAVPLVADGSTTAPGLGWRLRHVFG